MRDAWGLLRCCCSLEPFLALVPPWRRTPGTIPSSGPRSSGPSSRTAPACCSARAARRPAGPGRGRPRRLHRPLPGRPDPRHAGKRAARRHRAPPAARLRRSSRRRSTPAPSSSSSTGRPPTRKVIDCGTAFRPLEIWTYGAGPQPAPAGPLQARRRASPSASGLPIDSKRASTPRTWRTGSSSGRSLRCAASGSTAASAPTPPRSTQATGIDGLSPRQCRRRGNGRRQHRARLFPGRVRTSACACLARPAELADWAREAARRRCRISRWRWRCELLDLDFPAFGAAAAGPRPGGAGAAGGGGRTAGGGGRRAAGTGSADPAAAGRRGARSSRTASTFEDFRMRFQMAPPHGWGAAGAAFRAPAAAGPAVPAAAAHPRRGERRRGAW